MAWPWRRPRSADDFSAEVRAHLELEAARLVEDGLAPDEAWRAACRQFGNIAAATERFHESRRWLGVPLAAWESVWLDLRYAVRLLARAPEVCAAVALTLSLGIGVGASLLAVFTGLFLRPNVTRDPETFAKLFVFTTGGEPRTVRGEPSAATMEEFDAIREGSRTLAETTASAWATFRLVGEDSGQLRGLWVSCNYLRAHAPDVVLGRSLVDADCGAAGAPVAVLSARGWRRAFGAAADVVGRRVRMNGRVVEIVGVSRDAAVRDPVAAEVFVPYIHRPDAPGEADAGRRASAAWLSLSGRVAAGATPADAQPEVQALVDAVNRPRHRTSTAVVTNGAAVFDPSAGKYLPAVVGAGTVAIALVLILTCANASMLLLARAVAREGEWAMRARLGAPAARIVRQVLIESAVVSAPAWAIGVGLAHWLPAVVTNRLTTFPLGVDLTPDWRVWALSGGATLASGVVTGLMAARHAAAAGAWTATPRRHAWLLVPQLATCVALAAGVEALTEADRHWRSPDVPYDPDRVAVATLLGDSGRIAGPAVTSAAADVAASLRGAAGVTHVALASPAPFAGDARTVVHGPRRDAIATSVRVVSADYFPLIGTAFVRGRSWPRDDAPAATRAAVEVVVSEALSRLLGSVEPPAQVQLPEGRSLTVVGVVADTVSLRPDVIDGPLLYVPVGASHTPDMSVLARGPAVTPALARTLLPSTRHDVDLTIDSLSVVLARSGGAFRTGRDVLAAAASLALTLAVVGTAGAVAFQLRRRRRETAVRLALGATRSRLVVQQLRGTAGVVVVGVSAGAALSAVLAVGLRATHIGDAFAATGQVWPVLIVGMAAALSACLASLVAVNAAVWTELRQE